MKYGKYVEHIKNIVHNLRFKCTELQKEIGEYRLNPTSQGILINALHEAEDELKEMKKRSAQQFTQDEIKYIFG